MEMSEEEYYKEKIIAMVKEIKSLKFIHMMYGFVKRLYKEEKAGWFPAFLFHESGYKIPP